MKQQSWIFLFILILLLLIFILSSKSKQKKEILPITILENSWVQPRRAQDESNPVVKTNLMIIEKANDM